MKFFRRVRLCKCWYMAAGRLSHAGSPFCTVSCVQTRKSGRFYWIFTDFDLVMTCLRCESCRNHTNHTLNHRLPIYPYSSYLDRINPAENLRNFVICWVWSLSLQLLASVAGKFSYHSCSQDSPRGGGCKSSPAHASVGRISHFFDFDMLVVRQSCICTSEVWCWLPSCDQTWSSVRGLRLKFENFT